MSLSISYLGKVEKFNISEKENEFKKEVKKRFKIWEKFKISFLYDGKKIKYADMRKKKKITYYLEVNEISAMKEEIQKKEDQMIQLMMKGLRSKLNIRMNAINTMFSSLQKKILGKVPSAYFIVDQKSMVCNGDEDVKKTITLVNNGQINLPNNLYLRGDKDEIDTSNLPTLEGGQSKEIEITIYGKKLEKGLNLVVAKLYGLDPELEKVDSLVKFSVFVEKGNFDKTFYLTEDEIKDKTFKHAEEIKSNIIPIIRGLTKVRKLKETYHELKEKNGEELLKEVFRLGVTPIEC